MYFVQLKPKNAEATADILDVASDFDIDVLHSFDAAARGFSAKIPHSMVEKLEKLEPVERILLDKPQPYTPTTADDFVLDYGDNEAQPSLLRIGGPYQGSADLSAIHVAVLDTGIDSQHPDLRVFAEMDVLGVSSGEYARGTDPGGHGTHVAGIIGAKANGEGMVGVAPGVALHSVRVLNADGLGYFSDILAGLEYVLKSNRIQVVNLSLNTEKTAELAILADALKALEEAGIVVCLSAGNDSAKVENYAPAAYGHGIIVSAYETGTSDQGFASFSNYGPEVDIAAPGVDILSTTPGGNYERLSGTSQAVPHVAGAVALMLASNPDLSPQQIRNQLIANAEQDYPGQTSDQGRHPEGLLQLQ